MITGKINLSQLQHVVETRKKKDGTITKVITIPITENSLFLSDKGNCYLDLVAFDVAPEKRRDPEDTHMVCQSLSKEKRDAGVKGAILGNLRAGNSGGGGEQAPAAAADLTPEAGSGDLPF